MTTAPSRVALFYAPSGDDPLWQAGCAWLGRDAGERVPLPPSPNPLPQGEGAFVFPPPLEGGAGGGVATAQHPHVPNLTTDAAGYGFHATLKPPMRLVPGATWHDVVACVEALAQGVAPFDLPALELSNIHGFLALREATPCPALQALADLCVAGADHLRAPPDAAELARRRRHGLPPAQEAMLVRWGYPYVFATWFFHMTLTRRLTEAEHAEIRPSAEAHFGAVLQGPRRVADIGLFVQEAGGQFHLARRVKLCG